jgi:cytochrome c peroxidase
VNPSNLPLKHTKSAVAVTLLILLIVALFFAWQAQPSLGGPPDSRKLALVPHGYLNAPPPTTASIGEALFNDTSLSNPAGMSCATCHGAEAGFKYPGQLVNRQSGVAPGAVAGRFENRIPPTLNYAAYLPSGPPQFAGTVEAFQGGLFWDGHANNLNDQSGYPLQNPDEMNNTIHNVGSPAMVVQKVQCGGEAWMFRQVFGRQVFNQGTTAVFNLIETCIAAYESTPELSPFSSKYDAYAHGAATLSKSEANGLGLFTGSTTGRVGGPAYYKNAQCVDCHGISMAPGGIDLFTNACFDNIGVPKNFSNPYYKMTNARSNPAGYNPQGAAYVDLGLGGSFYPFQYNLPPGNIGAGSNGQGDFLGINGDFKAPSLRNVDKRPNPSFVKRYMHNGYFTDLKSIVHFYNTRNLTTAAGEVIDFTQSNPYANLQGKPLWPTPEYPSPTTLQNATGSFNNTAGQVGNLGLTDSEENDIVAFLKTLTDGFGKSYPVALPVGTAGNPGTPADAAMLKSAMRMGSRKAR